MRTVLAQTHRVRFAKPRNPMSTSQSRPNYWMLVLRTCLLVALTASAALAVDYMNPTGAFCASGSGCDTVRQSTYARLFGLLPVPTIGLLGFAGLLLVSVLPNLRLRAAMLAPLLIAAASIALLLIGLQAFVIGAFCWLCMVTDLATIGSLCALVGMRYSAPRDQLQHLREPLHGWVWSGLGVLAVVAPLLWPHVRPQIPVPKGIEQFYVDGRVNIVEFADFQCPFCRVLHERMRTVLANESGGINLVRLNAPLKSHEHARDAARAAICGQHQDRGEEMADALFEAEDLSLEGITRLAATVGLDVDLFDKCLGSRTTDARIDAELAILESAGFEGLPTVFIGQTKIVGAQPEQVLVSAIAAARSGGARSGIPSALYLVLVAIAAAMLVFFGRTGSKQEEARTGSDS